MISATPEMEQLFKKLVPIQSKEDRKKTMSELLDTTDYSKSFLTALREKFAPEIQERVSIITCTNKPEYIRNIFRNYKSQAWENKELILVLNSSQMDLKQIRKRAEKYQNVSVYQLPERTSLGHCKNFAVKQAAHDYIAVFDDDDYYAPQYLSDLMLAFRYTNADIVGKRSYYIYLESRQLLGIRHPGQEYKFLEADEFLDGGKKIVKKKVYEEVQYRNVSTKEDVYFCEDCAEKGFTMFSADRYNLVYMRRKNKRTHTWKEQDRRIIKSCSVIGQTEQYKESAIL